MEQQYADEIDEWINEFEENETFRTYREKFLDYDNEEIYGDKGKDTL